MVIFEAARAITELNGVTNRELTPAITVLQLFLSSSKPVLRFAAVRTLNKVFWFFTLLILNCLLLVNCQFVWGNRVYLGNACGADYKFNLQLNYIGRNLNHFHLEYSFFYSSYFLWEGNNFQSMLSTRLNFLQVAMTHPMAVTNCNIDMESLISDQNRSIATLAITTLLKTGNESSVDRLMKQITNFMSDIADEFKIVVVEAIRSLCLKFPLKYRSL